jgi:2-isopropylmalate synthase
LIITVSFVKHRAELLGYHFEGEELNTLYENFLIVADEKGSVDNEDLQVLVGNMPVLSR